jgi:hypothetical protein
VLWATWASTFSAHVAYVFDGPDERRRWSSPSRPDAISPAFALGQRPANRGRAWTVAEAINDRGVPGLTGPGSHVVGFLEELIIFHLSFLKITTLNTIVNQNNHCVQYLFAAMGMQNAGMAKRNSQNVRLQEEVIEPLNQFIRPRGKSQQHVVSVGAWFYMCMPETLTPMIGKAFEMWCTSESRPASAFLPNDCPELLRRIIGLIHVECSREFSREANAQMENLGSTPGLDPDSVDAKQALGDAASALEGKPTSQRGTRKGRQIG